MKLVLPLLVVGAVAGGGCLASPEPSTEEPSPISQLPFGDSEGELVCEVGERRACECDAQIEGEQVCASPDGVWSACGCLSQEGSIYVPPPPPVIFTCGPTDEEIVCLGYPEPETEYSAVPCCTVEDTCGSTNFLLVAFQCLERIEEPAVLSSRCPDESITFVDLRGCCLPSGMCGLTMDDTLPNWDIGCVERTEMREILDQGFGRKIVAALFGLSGEVPMWETLSCN